MQLKILKLEVVFFVATLQQVLLKNLTMLAVAGEDPNVVVLGGRHCPRAMEVLLISLGVRTKLRPFSCSTRLKVVRRDGIQINL